MARGAYEVGALVRATATFQVGSTATDPSTITAIVRPPSGSSATYVYGTDAELVKDSTGVYHVDIDVNAAGRWVYRFAGSGAAQAAGEEIFIVEDSEV
jgi:hypothetical protein